MQSADLIKKSLPSKKYRARKLNEKYDENESFSSADYSMFLYKKNPNEKGLTP
jgi:hypothetical protein